MITSGDGSTMGGGAVPGTRAGPTRDARSCWSLSVVHVIAGLLTDYLDKMGRFRLQSRILFHNTLDLFFEAGHHKWNVPGTAAIGVENIQRSLQFLGCF